MQVCLFWRQHWRLRCLLVQAPALATSCSSTLTAELTEGPYYLDDILFRSNITETESGIPVTLNVYLLDTDCNPVVDAFISIWHANASGIYSGFTGELVSVLFFTATTVHDHCACTPNKPCK